MVCCICYIEWFYDIIVHIFKITLIIVAARDHDKLAMLTQQLYDVLAKGQLLGRVCHQRSTILKTLFKLLDPGSPSTLLKLARLILAVSIMSHS